MYIASIDCGTTNSRIYIIDETAIILGRGRRSVGVRNTAMSGSPAELAKALKECLADALEEASLTIDDLDLAVGAGMITSELGLKEIPHIEAPAGVPEISKNIFQAVDERIFPKNLPVYFIPGIKNSLPEDVLELGDADLLDFMRGEETQVAGILEEHGKGKALTVVVLSSHTKFISIQKDGDIRGSITTLSGQLYNAIKKETFIGKSISGADDDHSDYFDEDLLVQAWNCVESSGFLRSLMMSRFFDVLMDTEWYQRRFFVEASLAAEDMRALSHFEKLGFKFDAEVILIGSKRRCTIYKYLIEKYATPNDPISMIFEQKDIDQLNITGALAILKTAKIIK